MEKGFSLFIITLWTDIVVDDIIEPIDDTTLVKPLIFNLYIGFLFMRHEEDIGLFSSINLFSKMGINLMIQRSIFAWSTYSAFQFNCFYFSKTELIGEVVTYDF